MTAHLIAALAAAVTLLDARSQAPPDRPGARLRIDTVVVDRNGAPVLDLRPAEFEVWINGYRVPIESVTAPGADAGSGRITVLILDDVTLEPSFVPRVRDAARQFVTRMGQDDQLAIATLSGAVTQTTSDRARLLREIDAYNVRASGFMRVEMLAEHFLGMIASISRSLAEAAPTRKTIVGIGASWLFDTPVPPPTISRDLRPEWNDAMRAMAVAKASLYVIEPGGVGMSPLTGTSGFARETGGHAFSNVNDLKEIADRIVREAASYYVLEIVDPPVGRNSVLRELDVRVLRRGITVHARRALPGSLPRLP